MITDFFARANTGKRSQKPSLPVSSLRTDHASVPPPRPPPVITPQVLPTRGEEEKHSGSGLDPPEPYPCLLHSTPTPHPNVTVDPIHMGHIPQLARITTALLPVKYPSTFYPEAVTSKLIASVSRAAVYHDVPPDNAVDTSVNASDKVIGAIRCRLEPAVSTEVSHSETVAHNLYIQTLLLLGPFRGNGIATSLLNSVLYDQDTDGENDDSLRLSPIVKHYNIRTVSAHVHESNEEALAWYVARGFEVQPRIIAGYYRKLRPSGAKVVVKVLHWKDDGEPSTNPGQRHMKEGQAVSATNLAEHGS